MAVSSSTDDVWPLFLGGSARPTGCGITFIDAPLDRVLDGLLAIRRGRCEVARGRPMAACIDGLDPMEAPWSREVLIRCDGWTAYLNNGRNGGDITAVAPAVARAGGWRCVSAQHMPRYGPGHAATQLWLQGPDGVPPLMQVRTISAYAADGRWSWHESGEVQPFERVDRYAARRKADRLDRDLLVGYLDALGIRVDDPRFYADAVAVVRTEVRPGKTESVEEFRAANGWS